MSDEMTRSLGKQSLPQGWSYPLSARDVECQLQGVRIPPELTLSFHWRFFGLRASEHLALVRAGSALPVLEASISTCARERHQWPSSANSSHTFDLIGRSAFM